MSEAARVLDLFAGPGGWDCAATELGLDPLGIEYDDNACATRKAAGLRTLQADVAALDPADFAPCELLIASPPCQAWSMAGKRQGELDKARVMALAGTWAADPAAPAGGGVGRRALASSRTADAMGLGAPPAADGVGAGAAGA